MQARPPGVVGDANVRTPSRKGVDSVPFGRGQIDTGEDTEPTTAVEHRTDVVLQQPETVPLDERTDQVDLVGGGKLAASFRSAGLISHFIISVFPVILGSGIPLLAPTRSGKDSLRLVETKPFASGVVQLSYERARNA